MKTMTNRRKIIPTIIAAVLVALFLPVMASAQGNYDPWNRNRDDRRDRRNDDYYNRSLRDSIRRVKDRSDDFRDHLDSSLDHSRYDRSRREDRINDVARDFENAADRLKDRFGDGRDLNRSYNEAQRLLQIGVRIDQFMSRNRLDGRVTSDWAQIRQDLRVIANAYGNYGGYNDPYNRRDRRNDTRSRIGDIFRNFPF
jgi:hypothetical protein